jgi:acyl-CoA reductase-like NAD-dependent aldehyde dehydrogenase
VSHRETFEPHDDAYVDKALAAARRAFEDFSLTSFAERARLMVGAADLYEGELPTSPGC